MRFICFENICGRAFFCYNIFDAEIKVSWLPSVCPCLFISLGLNWMFILYTTELAQLKQTLPPKRN